MNIAIIPARGGSKRIPRKNIRVFAGKPMIAYAVTAAIRSDLFEHIIVSTDDQQIAELARKYGAEVPFLRPRELADDYIATVPVIAHAVAHCGVLGWNAEHVCCIYPAVPFLQTDDLLLSLQQLMHADAEFCFPVTEFPASVQRALRRDNQGNMMPLYPEHYFSRTQDLEPTYYDTGQFYWGKAEAWLQNPKIHSQGSGYVIPNWRVADIDTLDDWKRAELMYKALNHNS